MKKFSHGHGKKEKKVVAAALGIIGLIIFINTMPMRFLLFFISIILLIMGTLLLIK